MELGSIKIKLRNTLCRALAATLLLPSSAGAQPNNCPGGICLGSGSASVISRVPTQMPTYSPKPTFRPFPVPSQPTPFPTQSSSNTSSGMTGLGMLLLIPGIVGLSKATGGSGSGGSGGSGGGGSPGAGSVYGEGDADTVPDPDGYTQPNSKPQNETEKEINDKTHEAKAPTKPPCRV